MGDELRPGEALIIAGQASGLRTAADMVEACVALRGRCRLTVEEAVAVAVETMRAEADRLDPRPAGEPSR